MYFKCKLLYDSLNQFKKVIIYGTGDYALKIYPYLVQYGLKDKIVCFTQTKVETPALIDGIPVVKIDEISYSKNECIVLIAVSELYLCEIKETLLAYNYKNYVSLPDYKVNYRQSEAEISQLKTFAEYCGYIADWYTQLHETDKLSRIVYQNLIDRGEEAEKEKNLKLIVMVCGHLSPRTVKIITALKKKNYEVVLLKYWKNVNPWCLDRLQKANIQVEPCECIEELMYKMLQYLPLVYFVEPRWGDCLWAKIILKNKRYFGKIVLALYDVMNDGYVGIDEEKLMTERYALENSDGIVWRWFSKEYLADKGFIYQGKSIQFLDYCCCEGKYEDADSDDASVVKICAGDGYGDISVEDREYTTKYIDYARIGEILAKIGNRQDCIFHYYSGSLSEKSIKRCIEYQLKYKNFKFFLGIEYDEFLTRLRNYDFGSELWIDGVEPPNDVSVGEYWGSNYRDCVRNIYFDFIEAGLPIITTSSSKLWAFLSAYDIVIKMTLSNLDIAYLKQNTKYYRNKVKEARQELNIDNKISELIQFLKEV